MVKTSADGPWIKRARLTILTLGLEIPRGHIVHHKDENPLNDNPLNLQIISRSEHGRIHSALPSAKAWREARDKSRFGRPISEETRRKMSLAQTGRWEKHRAVV